LKLEAAAGSGGCRPSVKAIAKLAKMDKEALEDISMAAHLVQGM